MDVDSEHLGIPDIAYHATVKLPSSEFQRICRDISVMSESGAPCSLCVNIVHVTHLKNQTVTIDVIKEGIRFSASGDTGTGSVSLKPSSGSIDDETDKSVTIELNQPISMTLSLKYLLNFTKAATLSDSVCLSMKAGIPLLVEYKASDVGYIRCVFFHF